MSISDDDTVTSSSEIVQVRDAVSNYPALISSPASPIRSDISSQSHDDCHVNAVTEAVSEAVFEAVSEASALYNPLPPSRTSVSVAVSQLQFDRVITSAFSVNGPRHSPDLCVANCDHPQAARRSARHVNFQWGIVRSSLDMATAPDRNRYPRSPCSPFKTPPPASKLPQPLPDFLRKAKIASAMSSLLKDPNKGFTPLSPAAPTGKLGNVTWAHPDALVKTAVEPFQDCHASSSSSDIPDLEPFCDQMSNYMPLLD